MDRPFHLGLRDGRHMVSVVRLPESTREVLGVAWPEDTDRRARIPDQWGVDARSPRRAEPATVDEPLPRRTQTILTHRLDPTLAHRLDSGMAPPASSRRDAEGGVQARAHLGPGHAVLGTRPGVRRASEHRGPRAATPTARARLGTPGPRR